MKAARAAWLTLWLLFALAVFAVGCPTTKRPAPVLRWPGEAYLDQLCRDRDVCLDGR